MKVGVFSDTHYAKGKQYGSRYCSLSLEKLSTLIDTFNKAEVDFSVCLGDTIDSSGDINDDLTNLDSVYGQLQRLEAPVHICIGNHDLEAMDKKSFLKALHSKYGQPYYSFIREQILFIVLDGNNKEDEEYKNGNFDWTESYIDNVQLNWLRHQLFDTTCSRVYIFIHQNLDDRVTDGRPDPHVVKNAAEVRDALQTSGKSVTVFQGHDHAGGEQTIEGIRYITVPAVVEGSDTKVVPYAVVDIDE